MAQLTLDERAALHAAMLGAFPERSDLEQLLQLKLGLAPAAVAPDRTNQETALLTTINWFEARSRVLDLVTAAAAARPQDLNLGAVAQAIQRRLGGGGAPPGRSGGSGGGTAQPAQPAPAHPAPAPAQPAVPAGPGGGAGPVPGPGGGGSSVGGYLKVLLGFAILAVFFILILVFTRGALTSAQWSFAKMAFALASAIFAIFIPGIVRVKLGTWLHATGAIGVFCIVFFLTPPPPPESTMTVSGYIQYVGTKDPVANAIIVYPQNNLRSNPTPADGYFALNGVPTGETNFLVQAGGKTYDLKITTPNGEQYPIVKRDLRPVDSDVVSVSALRWTAIPTATCPGGSATQRVAAFKLTTSIAPNPFGPTLLFRVLSTDAQTRLAQVLDVKPDNAASVATPDPVHQRQWEVKAVPDAGMPLAVTLCLTRDGKQRPNAQHTLRFEYWYRRME